MIGHDRLSSNQQAVSANNRPFSISNVVSEKDLSDTIQLFQAYAESLGIDLNFQDFATEMSSMPGKYAPPSGRLLLARNGHSEPIGCVGLRMMADNVYEMKRLYVDPQGRGTGVGKALALEVMREAKVCGYRAMRLDTLPSMRSASTLYRNLGFVEVEAYYKTPSEGTIFLEVELQ